jgi:hypothetical protein
VRTDPFSFRRVVEVKGKVIGGPADENVVRRELTMDDLQAENKALRKLLKRAGKVPSPAELQDVLKSPPPAASTVLPVPPPTLAPPPSSQPLASPTTRWEPTEDVDGILTADLTTVGMSAGVENVPKRVRRRFC